MKTKSIILIFLFSVALWLLVDLTFKFISVPLLFAPMRGIVGFVGYFILTCFLVNKYKENLLPSIILIVLLIGTSIFLLPYSLIHLPQQLVALVKLVSFLLGIFTGYVYSLIKTPTLRVVVVVMSLGYCIVYYLCIYPACFEYATR